MRYYIKKSIKYLLVLFVLAYGYSCFSYNNRNHDLLYVSTYTNLTNNIHKTNYSKPVMDKYNNKIVDVKDGVWSSLFNKIDIIFVGPGQHKMEWLRSFVARNSVSVYFTGEPNTPDTKKWDLSLGFDYLDDENYLRYPFYVEVFSDKLNLDYKRGKCEPKKKKYFACFLYRNGSTKARGDNNHTTFGDGIAARKSIFEKLSKYKFVASGGKYMNNINYVVPYGETADWLENCKFVISYESRAKDGYLTEKLPQAYFAGSIPIYYGSPSYYKDVNKKAVIYEKDFADQDALVEYIKKVDKDDDLYCKIWNERLIVKEEQTFAYKQKQLIEKYEKYVYPKINI